MSNSIFLETATKTVTTRIRELRTTTRSKTRATIANIKNHKISTTTTIKRTRTTRAAVVNKNKKNKNINNNKNNKNNSRSCSSSNNSNENNNNFKKLPITRATITAIIIIIRARATKTWNNYQIILHPDCPGAVVVLCDIVDGDGTLVVRLAGILHDWRLEQIIKHVYKAASWNIPYFVQWK
jgi:hypothetical protein